MKKLLSTSAILGALAISASSANAANLQVNVGGFLDFQAGYTSDDIVGDSSVATDNDDNKINFNNDTEVQFTVEGKGDNGLEYGAVVELEADINAGDQAGDGGANADKTYLFVQGGWGRAELGGNTDSSEALSVNTSRFASATGGVDGDFYRYLSANNPGGTNAFIVSPDLPIAEAGVGATGATANDEDATKVTYYTPRFSGFQAGVSYIPNSQATGVAAINETGYENVWTGGVNYSGEFSGVGVKAAITGQTGDAKDQTVIAEDLSAWDAGLNVSFSGFTVGGSYGDWTDSLGTNTDAEYYDIGAGYASGPFSVSVTYLNSDVDAGVAGTDDDEFDNLSVGADYQLAPGLVPYIEASFFDFDSNGTGVANDNDGTVVLVGTELTF